jgi:hypothetical protein
MTGPAVGSLVNTTMAFLCLPTLISGICTKSCNVHLIPGKLSGSVQKDCKTSYLVELYEEDDVIAEDREPVQRGHLDHKREKVVNDGVEELVRHLAPGEVRHALQLVVEVQLRAAHARDMWKFAKSFQALSSLMDNLP